MSATVRSFLWLESGAEEAARFYVSLFADGKIKSVETIAIPDGGVEVVEFSLQGADFVLMGCKGGPAANEAFSISVLCDDQAEVDRLWGALVQGGEEVACGWLKDRFGFSWQITPKRMNELMEMGTEAQRSAVMGAMMGMVKFDIAALESAFSAS